MVKTGIKEYDELKSKGLHDADYMRYIYNQKKKDLDKVTARLDRMVKEQNEKELPKP